MAEFIFTSPEGIKYSVTGPEGASHEQAFAILQQQLGGAKPPAQSAVPAFIRDIPKEIKGAFNEGLAGVTDNIGPDASGKPPDMLSNPFGIPKAIGGAVGMAMSPLTGAARSVIGHPMASAVQTVGEMIRPEMKGKVSHEQIYEDVKPGVDQAMSAIRPAGTPTVSRLPATQRTIQTPTGPATVTQQGGKVVSFDLPKADVPVPTPQDVKAASQAGYKSQDVTDVRIHPGAVHRLSNQLEVDLLQEGFRPSTNNAPGTFAEVRRLRPGQGVQAVEVADLDAARRALGKYAKQVDVAGQPTTEAAAAQRAIDRLSNFLPNLRQSDLLAGDAGQANATLGRARQDWAAYKRASLVDTLEQNALTQAATTYGGGNVNNSIRQAFRPFLKNNAAKLPGWSPESVDAFGRVATGGSQVSPNNLLRQAGRFAPQGYVSGMGHLIAASQTGGASIPLAVAAHAAKKAGIAMTRANVRKVQQMLLRESALYQGNQAAAPATLGAGTKALGLLQAPQIGNFLQHGAGSLGMLNPIFAGADNEQQ